MPEPTMAEDVGGILRARGWIEWLGRGVRCWQDPLHPDFDLVGMEAAVGRELRRESWPHRDFDLAVTREELLHGD